jgi:dTDP-4-dehydrorhamnose reductase
MATILVIGSEGQLGRSLSLLSDHIEGLVLFTSRKDLDLLDQESIAAVLKNFKADYIINCAAYTAVDKAEEEVEMAFNVNERGLKNLISASEELQSKIIHVSTDYVFDGNGKRPYKVSDPIDPQSVYGKSKAAGEKALADLAPHRSIIIRTSWLYSEFGHNFLKTMLRLGAEKKSIQVVNDQIGSPTYAKDLALAIIDLIKSKPQLSIKPLFLHFSNKGESNWYEFAKEIMKEAQLPCEVIAIPSSAYPTPAKRPSYSVLDISVFESILPYEIRTWQEALKDCINIIKHS